MKAQKITLIALNEFNDDLLRLSSKELGLIHIGKLLSLERCEGQIKDSFSSDLLEPWVQWVGIHTGMGSESHGIRHLGDIPALKFPQLWETLGLSGVKSGVWGALNGAKGKTNSCSFFVPDPWTFSESAFPSKLSPFVDFVRYVAKNRTSLSLVELFKLSLKLASSIPLKTYLKLLRQSPLVLRMIRIFGKNIEGYFILFEYIAVQEFVRCKQKFDTDFSFIFLNSLAHSQHYYWRKPGIKDNPELIVTLKFCELMIGDILSSFDESEKVVFTNGLSQERVPDSENFLLYRLKNLRLFLERHRIAFSDVEALMSYDATIIFDSKTDKKLAINTLSSMAINDEKLFFIDSEVGEDRLFFRVNYSGETSQNQTYHSGQGATFNFNDDFSFLARRTAKHTQKFHTYTSLKTDSSNIKTNTDINRLILASFKTDSQARADKSEPSQFV